MITLPCLSIRQPWAWLIVHGYKDIENREWSTKVRGRILIHASKTMTRADYEACCVFVDGLPFDVCLPRPYLLERGGIVGTATLGDCVTGSSSPWFNGPFGFVFTFAAALPFKQLKGRLGFFPVSVDPFTWRDRIQIHSYPPRAPCPDCNNTPEPAEEDDEEGCCFPGECCMPGSHLKSECHTPDMIEGSEHTTQKEHDHA